MNRYQRYGYNNHPGKSILLILAIASFPAWGMLLLMAILGI